MTIPTAEVCKANRSRISICCTFGVSRSWEGEGAGGSVVACSVAIGCGLQKFWQYARRNRLCVRYGATLQRCIFSGGATKIFKGKVTEIVILFFIY